MCENNTSVPLKKVSIQNLDPGAFGILVVGIIIGKQRPKTFTSTSGQSDSVRAVWNFTIRDSFSHYINVTYWGSAEAIFQTNDTFKTGDVVQICNPQVFVRNAGDKGEEYHPMVTSPFKLVLGAQSDIMPYPPDPDYLKLLRYPTKLTAYFVPLIDIHNKGASIKDSSVDVLGAVRGLGQIRTVTTKFNDKVQVRDVEVFDHTCPNLKITIWETDIIQRSNSWKPRVTILFFTDLKVDWSQFDRAFVAKVTGRTIVTENPISPEAEQLSEYASYAPIEMSDVIDQLIESTPLESITEILTVKHVHDRINALLLNQNGGNRHFMVRMFAFVTELDLDGLTKTLLIKCGRCKMTLATPKCENPECPVVFQNENVEPEFTFDIKMVLTDHTGSLVKCRLSGQTAEKVLSCSAQVFAAMADDERCALKWRFLLKQCSVRVGVFFIRQKPTISILSIEVANTCEVASLLPVY